jgi:hypothetical protein
MGEYSRIPGTSVRRTAAAENIDVPLVCRIIHEHAIYATTSSESKHTLLLTIVIGCHQLLTECVVNIQFVANILFTEEAGFATDGTANLHNSHV